MRVRSKIFCYERKAGVVVGVRDFVMKGKQEL